MEEVGDEKSDKRICLYATACLRFKRDEATLKDVRRYDGVRLHLNLTSCMQGRRQGGTTGNFSRGPQPRGGPWGPIAREIFFFNFKERKKLKTFGPGR